MKLDLKIFLVEAIVTNSKLEKLVSSYYQKNKFRAYAIAKSSELYSHPIIRDGDIKNEVLSKRTLGLILLAEENPNEYGYILADIFKTGWANVSLKIDTLIKTKSPFVIDDFIKNRNINNMNDDEFNAILVVAYILAISNNLEIIESELFLSFLKTLNQRYHHYFDNTRLRYDSFSIEEINQGKKLIERIEKKYYGIFNNADNMIKKFDDMDIETSRIISYNQFIFDLEDMMFTKIVSPQMDKKLLVSLATLYYLINKNYNVDLALKFLVPAYIQIKLLKAIKDTKCFYFQHNEEAMYFELEKFQNEIVLLQDELEFSRKKIKILQSEIDRLKKEYKISLEKEISELKKESTLISSVKEENNELKKELAVLRSHIYESSEDFTSEIESNDSYLQSQIKAIVIGGHTSWQSGLKNRFPSFEMVSGEGNNSHLLDHILEYDLVLFNTAYLGHPFYIKVIEKIRHSNISFGYIQHNNLDIATSEIMNIINKIK